MVVVDWHSVVDAVEFDIDVVKTVVSVVLICDIATDDDRFEDVITELVSPLVEAIFNYNEVTHMQTRNFFFSLRLQAFMETFDFNKDLQ